MNVLAIDQGTSSTKAAVVGATGAILGEAEAPVRSRSVSSDGVEQDPEEIWASVLEAGREALRRGGEPIEAIGLANQGETVLVWDRGTGRPLSAAISWQDRRSTEICERLSGAAEELRHITGLPLDPYFSAPKIAWLRENHSRDGTCTTTDAWLLHRLAGVFVTDAATASRTLLLDLDTAEWSARACGVFGIDEADLPRVVDCAGIVGESRTFGAAAPVAGLAVDQQAALFAEACFEAGEAKCTYGTGAFLLTSTGSRPPRSSAGLVACVAWRLGGRATYCLDGQVYTVGAAADWLQRIGIIGGAGELDGLAARASDSAGVCFIPALAGLAAPFWRPSARGAFVGLSLAAGREHMVRAFLEGIAAQVAWLAAAVADDLGRPLVRLRADGGLTRSRQLMQIQADLAQVPVEIYPTPHATALGAAAFARLGAGAADDPRSAVGSWTPAHVYEPRISADEAGRRLHVWRRVAEATMELG